jgi:hypothetical protein
VDALCPVFSATLIGREQFCERGTSFDSGHLSFPFFPPIYFHFLFPWRRISLVLWSILMCERLHQYLTRLCYSSRSMKRPKKLQQRVYGEPQRSPQGYQSTPRKPATRTQWKTAKVERRGEGRTNDCSREIGQRASVANVRCTLFDRPHIRGQSHTLP